MNVELDVRPYLREKKEPFELIMKTVKSLKKDDTFILHATFKPTPLLGVMRVKGYVSKVEQLAPDHWVVTFVRKHRARELEGYNDTGSDTRNTESGSSKTEKDSQTETTPNEPKIMELDNRGLEPPQPMIRTLAALDRAKPGDKVKIHNDRVPVFLLEELNNLGYPYEVEEQDNGSAKVTIEKR